MDHLSQLVSAESNGKCVSRCKEIDVCPVNYGWLSAYRCMMTPWREYTANSFKRAQQANWHILPSSYLSVINEERCTFSDVLLARNAHSSASTSSWRLTPKQDHLVCFFGGSLMLGAATARALVDKVSIPPRPDELMKVGLRDWKSGVELINTCMRTHDTATFASVFWL